MTPRQRLTLWIFVVAGSLAPGALRLLGAEFPATVVLAMSLTIMLRLLETTPADAIRLRPATSVVVVGAGSAWLALASGPVPAGIAGIVSLGLGVVAWKRGVSPWWAVPVAWSPGVGLALLPGSGLGRWGAVLAIVCAGAALARPGAARWVFWSIACVISFWLAM